MQMQITGGCRFGGKKIVIEMKSDPKDVVDVYSGVEQKVQVLTAQYCQGIFMSINRPVATPYSF